MPSTFSEYLRQDAALSTAYCSKMIQRIGRWSQSGFCLSSFADHVFQSNFNYGLSDARKHTGTPSAVMRKAGASTISTIHPLLPITQKIADSQLCRISESSSFEKTAAALMDNSARDCQDQWLNPFERVR